MPLQHISNLTLLAMNRPARNHTVALLEKLRERIPGLVLRTTFICGFPGETQEQHDELVDFCKDFRFERMGAFTYSEEDGTPAAEYPDQVRAVRLFSLPHVNYCFRKTSELIGLAHVATFDSMSFAIDNLSVHRTVMASGFSEFQLVENFDLQHNCPQVRVTVDVQVDEEERLRRRDKLVSLQQRIGEVWARSMVGRTLDVLVDGVDEDGVMVGRTEYDAPDIDHQVLLTDSDDPTVPRLEAGQMRKVTITDNITFDLVGMPVA
jgi:tRNA A37 methylthiotransferase MiaB